MTKHTIARSARGSDCFLWLAGVPSLRDSTPAYALTSLRDSNFRSPMARQLFANSRFDADGLIMSKLALMLVATRAPYYLPSLTGLLFRGGGLCYNVERYTDTSKITAFCSFSVKNWGKT